MKLYHLPGIFGALLLLMASCRTTEDSAIETTTTTVFEAGTEGYSHYRIPALLRNERYLFAFSEARKNSVSDHGDISIVLRRSTDLGQTWGPLIRVLEVPGESLQNPAPIYVEEANKLILLFTKRTDGTDTERMIREGSSKGYVGVFQTESYDEGQTWSEVKEITTAVKRADWRWYAMGPAGVIRMQYNDQYRGRIIVPANHSTDGGWENEYLGAHVIYSDDGGASWRIGAVDSEGESTVNPNETTVIELRNGDLYFNTRNHSDKDTIAHRAVAISKDGGASFTGKFTHEKQLRTPIVHAGITRTEAALYFFAPSHETDRLDLSLWRSTDEGVNWQYVRQLYDGSSAYSSACRLSEQQLGLLLEVDDYSKILYMTVSP